MAVTRLFVKELAGEYGLVARVLSAGDELWSAEITGPAGRTSDGGGLVAMYSSWSGNWQAGNTGLVLAPHEVRDWLARFGG